VVGAPLHVVLARGELRLWGASKIYLIFVPEVPMYRGKKYRIIPSCADRVYLPSLIYTIILYINLIVLASYDGFTIQRRLLFEVAKFNMFNSAINDSRVFVIFIEEWIVAASAVGFRLKEIQKSCSGRTHHENTAMFLIACYFSRNSTC